MSKPVAVTFLTVTRSSPFVLPMPHKVSEATTFGAAANGHHDRRGLVAVVGEAEVDDQSWLAGVVLGLMRVVDGDGELGVRRLGRG